MIFLKPEEFIFLTKGEQTADKPKKSRYSWTVNETKYLDSRRTRKLRRTLKEAKDTALKENKTIPIRDWFMVELGLYTGLRVDEMVNLKTTDLYLQKERPFLFVRKGKGNKSRTVYFPGAFKNECLWYLNWQKDRFPENDYLFAGGNNEHLTKRALQKSFKRCTEKAGIERHYSIHCLRHTYGSFLYKASGHNLRLVQEQLGHSSIRTTQVYAGIMDDDVKKALDRLYEN